jgi:hypothetical protein
MRTDATAPFAAALQPSAPRDEWVRRFAYRAMLLEPSIDSVSATMMAEGQFELACDLEPEEAAEIHVARG